MATIIQDDTIEDQQRQAPALIRYLAPGNFVTRRYVRAGAEINTGEYRDYEAVVRDGMPIRGHFQFDKHGFMIGKGNLGRGLLEPGRG
jgi:hypothetical protein